MDHSKMDHGDMVTSPVADHESQCSMNMSFSWAYKDTCIIFDWWHIRTKSHLLLSCLVIASLAVYYEYLKYKFTKYSLETLASNRLSSNNMTYNNDKLRRSIFYGIQVGFSFMLMLVFMTYNGWLMLAVVFGATLGYYFWSDSTTSIQNEQSSLACH